MASQCRKEVIQSNCMVALVNITCINGHEVGRIPEHAVVFSRRGGYLERFLCAVNSRYELPSTRLVQVLHSERAPKSYPGGLPISSRNLLTGRNTFYRPMFLLCLLPFPPSGKNGRRRFGAVNGDDHERAGRLRSAMCYGETDAKDT